MDKKLPKPGDIITCDSFKDSKYTVVEISMKYKYIKVESNGSFGFISLLGYQEDYRLSLKYVLKRL